MNLNVILKMITGVLICIALWLLLSIAVRSIILASMVGPIDEHSAGEPEEQSRADYWKTPDVPELSAMSSEIVFGGGIMTYNIGEKHWTLSDRFLEDVADALVPVLKERGFVQISYGPLSAYGVQADSQGQVNAAQE